MSRVFKEENLSYTVDENCVVHYFVDQCFDADRRSALAVIGGVKYQAVRAEFEEAYKSLDVVPPDTKEAVRRVFEALEIMYKLMTGEGGRSRLSARDVKEKLGPLLLAACATSPTEQQSLPKFVEAFASWVDAVHWYRHGQGVQEPDPPSMTYAVTLISTGAAFLRLMAIVDAERR